MKEVIVKVELCKVCKRDKKEVDNFLNTAISEISYALKSHKSKEVKEFYLENAIRFINRAKENLNA